MRHFSAKQLQEYLEHADPKPLLLDVREPWEYQYSHIAGSQLIPMAEIPSSIDTLDRNREIVVICHHGVRSHQVAYFLEHSGFSRVINLVGGTDAWANEVEPSMARY